MEENKENNNLKDEDKSGSWISRFIKRHIIVLLLVLAIIVVFIWSNFRINSIERSHEKQLNQLVSDYDASIDSLTVTNMKQTTKVFSWAVRSEMLRENTEQVNHFFNDFVKEPGIIKVQLIEPEDYAIIISTDKRDEGNVVDDEYLYRVDELTTELDADRIEFINPVMGLDRKLGILVIKMEMD